MSIININYQVTLSPDEQIATIRSGTNTPIVANVIAVERDDLSARVRSIHLRAKIHRDIPELQYQTWQPMGAINTILVNLQKGNAL